MGLTKEYKSSLLNVAILHKQHLLAINIYYYYYGYNM